jgi:hypothetical protein
VQGIAQAALHHPWEALDSGALQTVLPPQHVPGTEAVAIFYPQRSGLALSVRTVVDFLFGHLRADATLSRISKLTGPGVRAVQALMATPAAPIAAG